MELLSVIRRWHYRDHFSIREISRRTGLSRNTVRKYLRSDTVEPKFNIPDRPSKLDPYADKLSQMLRQESGKSRKQKRTTKQLHADLAALGYDGSYNRVAAFARDWKAARQQEQKTCGRGVFVPLAFLPGEALQFDGRKTGRSSTAPSTRPAAKLRWRRLKPAHGAGNIRQLARAGVGRGPKSFRSTLSLRMCADWSIRPTLSRR